MKHVLILCFTLCAVTTTNAQFLKKLGKKVEKAFERTLERKVEEKTEKDAEKVFDTIFNNGENRKQRRRQRQRKKRQIKKQQTQKHDNDALEKLEQMASGTEDVKHESAYTFSITATMQVTNFTKRNNETTTVVQSYGEHAIMSTIENTPNHIIRDFKNNSYMIITGNDIQLMSTKWLEEMLNEGTNENESRQPAKVLKTGRTKVINGYTCNEYNIVHEDVKINAWFAPNVNFTYQDYLRGFATMYTGNKGANPSQLLNEGYGYVMEMKAYLNGDLKSEMKVTQLSTTPKTLNTKEYTIQKMF